MIRIARVAAMVVALGCNQREEAPKAGPDEPQSSDVAARAEATALTDDAVDEAPLSVKEDFEEEAFQAIDEDNLESRVDALEAEITADLE